MWDKDWNLLPHGKVWVDLTTKTWWTNAEGSLDKQGVYQTRGFYGDYDVTVSQGETKRTYQFALSPQNGNLTVIFR
jgi:hypothetical protein